MSNRSDVAAPTAHPPEARRIKLFDVPFDVVTFVDALDVLVKLAQGKRPAYAVTANVDHVVRFSRRPEVRHLYTQADLVVADGTPLIWASRLLGTPLPERVTGADLFPELCARAAAHNLSVFLLGGAPGTAERAAKILQSQHPRLRVAGTHCPDYGFEEDPTQASQVVEAVRAARPDILFVGLGSPKQEKWIAANRDVCGAKLSIGIGISFSFLCGDVPRAPRWVQRVGLEWLHRLCQEPGRLWKRYLVEDLSFLILLVRALVRRVLNLGRSTPGAVQGAQAPVRIALADVGLNGKPSRRRMWRKLVLSAGGLSLGLVLAEGGVRGFAPARNVGPSFTVYDPAYGKSLKKGFSCTRATPEFTMSFTTNRLGFRGPDPESFPHGAIVFIGDSFTMGYGVNDGEEFPALVRGVLNERLDYNGIPVVNAGVGNTGNGRWLKFLRTEAPEYKPRCIVFQISGNDFADNVRERLFRVTEAGQLLESSLPQHGGVMRLAQRVVEAVPGLPYSHLVSLLRDTVTRGAAGQASGKSHPEKEGGNTTEPPSDQLTYRLVEEILDICRRQDWPVLALVVAVDPPRLGNLRAIFRRRHVSCIIVPQKTQRPSLYYRVDGHWNRAGHAHVADSIIRHLLSDETLWKDGH